MCLMIIIIIITIITTIVVQNCKIQTHTHRQNPKTWKDGPIIAGLSLLFVSICFACMYVSLYAANFICLSRFYINIVCFIISNIRNGFIYDCGGGGCRFKVSLGTIEGKKRWNWVSFLIIFVSIRFYLLCFYLL